MPPPPAHAGRHFEVDHVLVEPTLRSKYPPGWPALLAVGAYLGATWPVNGVLAALTMALLFGIARRLVEPRSALIALCLVAFSPFLLFNAASLHSHMSELSALVAAFYCLLRGWPGRSVAWAIAAGLAIGVAFLIRPADAVAFSAGALVLLRLAPGYVVACGLSALSVAALMPVYQSLQFGSPWMSGYTAYNDVLREIYGDWATRPVGPGFLVDPVAQWGHLRWF